MIEDADPVGGLDDEDAEGLPPSKDKRAFANDVSTATIKLFILTYFFVLQFVTIDESEEEDEEVTTLNPTRAKAKAPRSPIKLATVKPVITAKARKPVNVKPRSNAGSVKSRSVSVVSVKEESHEVGSSWSSSSTKSVMPSFMSAAWAKSFLPTLYDSLGRSEKPFSHFSKGPEIVGAIQGAIDLVWVGTDYRVQWGDEVCSKVSY